MKTKKNQQITSIKKGFKLQDESEVKVVQSYPTLLWPHYNPRNSPGQITGVGSLSLLQGIFPTQGLNPGLPHCRRILYQLSHKGSPRILEWVAYHWRRQWQPTQYCCLGRGAWWAAVHAVAKSRTWLIDLTFTFHFNALEKEMATHSSVLAWRLPGMAEPSGLPSMGSHRVGHGWSDLAVAEAPYLFSTVSSQPRNQAGVSCIAGWFFTNWAIRETQTGR